MRLRRLFMSPRRRRVARTLDLVSVSDVSSGTATPEHWYRRSSLRPPRLPVSAPEMGPATTGGVASLSGHPCSHALDEIYECVECDRWADEHHALTCCGEPRSHCVYKEPA